jgi:hypothetical protein
VIPRSPLENYYNHLCFYNYDYHRHRGRRTNHPLVIRCACSNTGMRFPPQIWTPGFSI